MFERSRVKEGMVVRSQDGEKLGRVYSVADDTFIIEKGLFFPKDYVVRLSEVAGERGGELILSHGRDSLRRLSAEEGYPGGAAGVMGVGGDLEPGVASGPHPGAMGTTGMTASSGTIGTDLGRDTLDTRSAVGSTELSGRAEARAGLGAREPLGTSATRRADSDREVSVPVSHEELDVVKREREAGQVRITKEVVTEEQELSVPVRKERVRVERRDVGEARPAMSASAFKDETIVVPLREEQVEVEKRARVSEEVVIHKDAVEEQRRVAETVRREKVDVRTEGDVEDAERSRSGFRAPDDDPLKRY
ncbi:MAG TPA: YsnF/AvaK domain-containing protein [Aggregicoccus sp.]|nr:YsnF/AvaK domain-containing protein [Aggregicoccus sp.]